MKKAKVLVLGGYGLIGAATVHALNDRDLQIKALGRSKANSMASGFEGEWVFADVTKYSVADWEACLSGVSVVVNAAGALQDGAHGTLEDIHVNMVANLCAAAADRDIRVVQISAAGAELTADTEFLRSKARGDEILRKAAVESIILKPTLVIGRNAFGGSAILRGVAGLPGARFNFLADSHIQTIGLEELAQAIADCVEGKLPFNHTFELSESEHRNLPQTIDLIRKWLGFPTPKLRIPMPQVVLSTAARCGDLLGRLGWRPALRTTSIKILSNGITADSSVWQAMGGRKFKSLETTLTNMPATLQDRWFSRLYFMMPVAIACLSVFWIASGLIGFLKFQDAAAVLITQGFGNTLASGFVLLGSCFDIFLGLLLLWRPFAKRASLGMIAVTIAYCLGALLFVPSLWVDPLGPMVKAIPAAMLALFAFLSLEDR
ncbi:SDR family oxidoreductase [Cognatishimia sp.]|uniref:SDR family oxidoreductase n=1 Tax=Cognatishimia sp. TaxID=2211648 RepID=UPI003512F596